MFGESFPLGFTITVMMEGCIDVFDVFDCTFVCGISISFCGLRMYEDKCRSAQQMLHRNILLVTTNNAHVETMVVSITASELHIA
jgi:hypothetical protein